MHYKDLEGYCIGEKQRLEMLKAANIPSVCRVVKTYVSFENVGEKNYSVTHEVGFLEVDEFGIIGDRHRSETHFRKVLREKYIYPKGSYIKQERHILGITDGMCKHIGSQMGTEITPELLGVNIVFEREDGNDFYFDGLPLGTDFMFYSADAVGIEDKEKFVVNFKLVTFQMGCGVTGVSIADAKNDLTQTMNFVKNSQKYRGVLLCFHGPQGKIRIEKGMKVFIKIPTGSVH